MRLYHFDSITSTTFSIIRQFRPLSVIVSPRTTLTMLVMYSPRSKILRCDVMTVVLVINTHELFIIRNNCAMSDRYTFYHTFAFGILRADGFRQMVHKQMVHGQMFHGPIVQGQIVHRQMVHGQIVHCQTVHGQMVHGQLMVHRQMVHGQNICKWQRW